LPNTITGLICILKWKFISCIKKSTTSFSTRAEAARDPEDPGGIDGKPYSQNLMKIEKKGY
jgi:hypothetical protein